MHKMLTLLASIALLLAACIEKDFDVPPVQDDTVELAANATIADIKDYYRPGEFSEITEDLIFDAIVVADDKAGNFYKKLVLQDDTGGIEIQINRTDLYTDYEQGRRVYVKAMGLYVADFNGLIQLGSAPVPGSNGTLQLGRIDNALVQDIVFRGPVDGMPPAKDVTINQLGVADISTLVRVCNVQFATRDTSGQLANALAQQTLNKNIEDCNFNTLIIRTSGFAALANTDVPKCSGCITGIYSIFGQDKQMFLRDEADLDMDGPRCNGAACGATGGGSSGPLTLSIENLRDIYTGTTSTLPADQSFKGVVIDDAQTGSTDGRNMVVQDSSGYGIVVRFSDSHNFRIGDEVFIDVSGVELSEFNKVLQVNGVGLGNARLIRSNVDVTPVQLTAAQLAANGERYESTLVKIIKGALSAADTNWDREVTVTDASGSIIVYTRPAASFALQTFPTDTVDVTSYVSEFNGTRQLVIRSPQDVVVSGGSGGGSGGGGGGGGGTGSPVTFLNVDFSSNNNFDPVSAPGWLNYTSIANGRVWQAREFSGNIYAQATAFNDASPSMDTWLITAALDLNAGLKISFETATSFNVHQGLEVLISTDFSGSGDPASATWTSLGATIANATSGDNNWVPSGDISLAAYSGVGYVAFRYTGSGSGNTSTFRVDNVMVSQL